MEKEIQNKLYGMVHAVEPNKESTLRERFEKEFPCQVKVAGKSDSYIEFSSFAHPVEQVMKFIKSEISLSNAELVGRIGAKLLARHSPQIVLDAYFDAANEELEENK